MTLHEFTLWVQLPDKQEDPRKHTDEIDRAGYFKDCENICYGILGHIAFEFKRKGTTLPEVKKKAWNQIQYAIPGVTLMELDREAD